MTNQSNKLNPKCLKDFKSSLKSNKLFSDISQSLPQFLSQNLVDQARTVKIFRNDNQSYIKIFYFQFLKLCFETDDIDYDTKINKFIQMIQTNQDLLKISQKFSIKHINSNTVKNILFEFLQILSECKQPIQITLARYPVVNDILTNFFCQYLTKFHKTISQQDKDQGQGYNNIKYIKILSQYFDIQIIEYNQCIQYTDSQIYSYKQNKQQIYLIYIDQSKAKRNNKIQHTNINININNICKNQRRNSKNSKCSNYSNSNKSLDIQNCQIIAFNGIDVVFNQYNQVDQSKIKIDLDIDTADTFRKTPRIQLEQVRQTDKQNIQDQRQGQGQGQVEVEGYNRKQNRKQNIKQSIKHNQIENDHQRSFDINTLAYNPKKYKQPKISYFNITKQFTDTYILDNIVSQPYRTKIKQLKTKARNQRKSRQLFL